MGLRDAAQDEHGIVLATVPATVGARRPDHRLDRPRRYLAGNQRPQRQADRPSPITTAATSSCPAIRRKVIRVADNPELADSAKARRIITTDGTTLLGADDKAGVAVIMEAAAHLLAHPEMPHGPIRVCFTCDEEIGHGVDHVDLKKLGAVVGYTLDGGGQGEIDGETFSADLAVVTITGVNIHPSIAKGRMVNAVRLAGLFLDRLPRAGAVAGDDGRTARASCIRTASRAASPR